MESTVDYLKLPSTRGGYKFPSLADLSRKLYGEAFKDAHNALIDIQNTAKIFWDLVDLKVIDPENPILKREEIKEEEQVDSGLTLF